MNGSEHYAEAENLLARADRDVSENMAHTTGEHKADVIAAAQVHATLALVAAQVGARRQDPSRQEFGHSDADRAFYEATS